MCNVKPCRMKEDETGKKVKKVVGVRFEDIIDGEEKILEGIRRMRT